MDPNFPSKLISFLLKVTDEGDRYEVEGCCPDLKAGVIYFVGGIQWNQWLSGLYKKNEAGV